MRKTQRMKKCRRTQLLFLFFLVVSNAALYAQNVLKGRVTDPADDPLIGVNVVIKGTTTGTISDIDGNFELNVSPGHVLTFTYMGYVPQEITITNQTVLNVILQEDTKTLDEIVVVSYGTQKKRNLTGAVSSLNASDLNDLPVGQLGQKLQGQIAGVQINQTTGKPGEGMAFRIRGAASVNAGNEPLFVVDGMVLSTGLNMINPDEIESFSVLKDAAAASLYGSRAANGVVLITTKKRMQRKNGCTI